MNREEFENQYIEKSDITKEEFDKEYIVLPCGCQELDCDGFCVVNKDPLSVKSYFDLYVDVNSLTCKDIRFILEMAKEYDKIHNDTFEGRVISFCIC